MPTSHEGPTGKLADGTAATNMVNTSGIMPKINTCREPAFSLKASRSAKAQKADSCAERGGSPILENTSFRGLRRHVSAWSRPTYCVPRPDAHRVIFGADLGEDTLVTRQRPLYRLDDSRTAVVVMPCRSHGMCTSAGLDNQIASGGGGVVLFA